MTGPLLEARGLVKRYGALLVTDGVDLTVQPGELHAIIGPNGAGKSTLIAQLAGELKPDAGTIWLGGEEVTRLHAPARALKGLARSYQITSVFPDFTVLENVALALQAHAGHSFRFFRPILGETRLTEPAHAALDAVGLAARAGDRVEDLAHGERRQLEVAMGLAANPKLLLLDEPMAGMSRPETQSIVALLQGLKGRFGILLVEHDMDAVFALADRISVLVYGRLIASGTPAEIRRNPDVVAAYLGEEAG